MPKPAGGARNNTLAASLEKTQTRTNGKIYTSTDDLAASSTFNIFCIYPILFVWVSHW